VSDPGTQLSPLRKAVVSGVKWGSASAGILFALALVQTAALARLLDPADFGLVAVSMVVIGLARAFADLGLSSAIVAKQIEDRRTLSSLYWASILAGVLIAAIVAASTPLVIRFFDEPRLSTILPLTALSFVIIPVGQQFQMLLQKELQVPRLVRVDIAAAVVGLVVGVSSALAGAGAVALVLAFLARLATSAALFAGFGWRTWRPDWRLRWHDLDGCVGFGLYQMGERCVNYLGANVDYIVIGRSLGVQALGAYSIAYQLVVKPVFELNPILTRVSFPAFAKKQDDNEALCRGYLEVIRLIGFVIVPTMVGVAVVAPLFVPVVFGDQWEESIVLLQILSIVGVLRALTSPAGDMLLAKGRPDVTFKVNGFILVLMIAALVLAVQGGLEAVAWAVAAVTVLDAALHAIALNRVIGLRVRDLAGVLRWPAVNSAIAAVAVLALDVLFRPHVQSQLILLLVELGCGALVYAGLVGRYEREYVRGLAAHLRAPRAPRAPSPS
jgi:O-antigen/teichoic acid export membrane protein